MNQYIIEKDLWQALNSIDNPKVIELLNYLLKLNSNFNVIFPSYARLSKEIGVSVRSIASYMKKLKDLFLITARHRFKKTDLMQLNPMIFKYAEKYCQILPALRQFINHGSKAIFDALCIHRYNEVNNIVKSSLSSLAFLFKFKNPLKLSTAESYMQYKLDISTKEQDVPTEAQLTRFKEILEEQEDKAMQTEVKAIQVAPLVINNPIERISKVLSLNNWGKIRLMVYPEKALSYMFEQLGKQNGLKAPFYWLLSALDKYCSKNKLYVDWDLIPMLKKKYAIADNPTYFQIKQAPKTKFVNLVTETPKTDKIITSEIVGKYKLPHPGWAQFIPADLKLA